MLYCILGYLVAAVAFYAWIFFSARPDPYEEPAAEAVASPPDHREAPATGFSTRAPISG